MGLTAELAEFAMTARGDADALRMMQLSVFDWAACGIAGQDEPAARHVREMVLSEKGAAQSALFGGGAAPTRGTALVNGVTSHALDYDDTHFAHIGHPSVVVVSAALAVAQHIGASGNEFLQAALIGVELSTRIGIWLGRRHYQTGFHQTGTAGCFGAAAATARLLGCDVTRMEHALGLASTKAAGLKSQFGTMGKPYNAGAASAAGVEVALLAHAGFMSNVDALDGLQGFGATHHGASDPAAFDGLGQTWLIGAISHKYHACCHGTHAMIEALQMLDVPLENVVRVALRTHPRWLKVCDQKTPDTGLGAKFSYRLIAALALSGHDTAALSTFSDELAQDAALRALRDKVDVTGDHGVAETAAVLEVGTKDGAVHHAQADISAAIPLNERKARLMRKAQSLVGGSKANLLHQAVLKDRAPDLDALAALLG